MFLEKRILCVYILAEQNNLVKTGPAQEKAGPGTEFVAGPFY